VLLEVAEKTSFTKLPFRIVSYIVLGWNFSLTIDTKRYYTNTNILPPSLCIRILRVRNRAYANSFQILVVYCFHGNDKTQFPTLFDDSGQNCTLTKIQNFNVDIKCYVFGSLYIRIDWYKPFGTACNAYIRFTCFEF